MEDRCEGWRFSYLAGWPSKPRGGRAFNSWGGGSDTALWLAPLPKKRLNSWDPELLPRLTPGAPEVTGPQIRQEMKTGDLEGSEKTSFTIYLVRKKLDHFQRSKTLSATLAPEFIISD